MIVLEQHPDILCWVREKSHGEATPQPTLIAWRRNGHLVAGMIFEEYSGEGGAVSVHVRIEAGWIPRQWWRACLNYAFGQLGVHKLLMPVASFNHNCRELIEMLGARCVATIPGAYPNGDRLVYELRKSHVNPRTL